MKKNKWFYSLRPNQKIAVKIYSHFCDCFRIAIVLNYPENDYIEAQINDKSCEQCASKNSRENLDKDITCWYDVNKFHKSNVRKINERN